TASRSRCLTVDCRSPRGSDASHAIRSSSRPTVSLMFTLIRVSRVVMSASRRLSFGKQGIVEIPSRVGNLRLANNPRLWISGYYRLADQFSATARQIDDVDGCASFPFVAHQVECRAAQRFECFLHGFTVVHFLTTRPELARAQDAFNHLERNLLAILAFQQRCNTLMYR